jgi:hypothetical protein
MPNAVMPNAAMQNVVIPNAIMLNAVILNALVALLVLGREPFERKIFFAIYLNLKKIKNIHFIFF